MGLSHSLDKLSSEWARPMSSTKNRGNGTEAHLLDKRSWSDSTKIYLRMGQNGRLFKIYLPFRHLHKSTSFVKITAFFDSTCHTLFLTTYLLSLLQTPSWEFNFQAGKGLDISKYEID